MTLRTTMKGLFGRTRKLPEQTTSVVRHEAIDDYVFDDLKRQAAGFREKVTSKPTLPQPDGSEAEFDIAPDAWADVFRAHHNSVPHVRLSDTNEILPSHRIIRDVMEEYVETPDFTKLKPVTSSDRTTSGLATMTAIDVLVDELRNGALREHAERAQEMADQEQRIAQAQAAADALRDQLKAKGHANEQDKNALRELAEAKADARQQLGAMMDEQEQGIPAMHAAAAEAVGRASEQANEAGQAWSAFVQAAGHEPGNPVRVPPEKALELAMRWRDLQTLRNISLIAGRVVRDSKAERRRNITGGREQKVDIRTGNDLGLLLPSEMLKLAHPDLRPRFVKGYVDRTLLVYETQSDEEAGLGPVIFLKDVSGTMGGERHEWATGVALALIGLAQRDSRACYALNYDSKIVGEYDFGRTPNLELLTDFACEFTGGGTRILEPMQRAEQIILQAPEFARADIVLITDGLENRFRPGPLAPLRESLSEKGVFVHGVSIGLPMKGNPWMDFCDTAVEVVNLDGPNEATRHLAMATV